MRLAKFVCLFALLGLLLADVAIGKEFALCHVRASWTAITTHGAEAGQTADAPMPSIENASAAAGTKAIMAGCSPELLTGRSAARFTEPAVQRHALPVSAVRDQHVTPTEGKPPRI